MGAKICLEHIKIFSLLIFIIFLNTQNTTSQSHSAGLLSSLKPLSVVAFFSSECPICKKSATAFAELISKYSDKVDFWIIFPGDFETKRSVEKFCKNYKLKIQKVTTVLDKDHQWVKKYNALITPEYFLIDQRGYIVYSGALDDRFVSVGIQKRKAEKFYLKESLEAALNNQPPPIKRTEPIGCYITKKD
ncbi:MAG: redoxin domain-containing protein [Flavobacteriales bacterium]|nr:redoxin domain-containing protein [Flavobacteriales bacterium]MCX7768714.1 redoxin domain-containing protein [Flavobacteriales bacterium]MDW8410964.1 redoxin domain-containing protein [Flavobacteriales bacterium]